MNQLARSILAYIFYTIVVLAGLKFLGANLTWTMVLFPLWGLGVVLVLLFTVVSIVIGAIVKS
jgi:hypothetical protein